MIIVNYNGKLLLKECLTSLRKQSYNRGEFETIVVDNGSNDGSVEYIKREFPEVSVIENRRNLGFAKACNSGIRYSSGEYIALLNNDTEVDRNWIEELANAVSLNEDVALGSSKIKLYGTNIIGSAGGCLNIFGHPIDRGFGEEDKGQYHHYAFVTHASGCAMLVKRDVLKKVGLFDEDIFLYHEDVDLSWRAISLGFKIIYVPTAVVYHKLSRTIGEDSPLKVYYGKKYTLRGIVKNLPYNLCIKLFFSALTFMLIQIMIYSVTGKRHKSIAILKAVIAFFKELPHALILRRAKISEYHYKIKD